MLFIFSTLVLIRHRWQLKTAIFLHWCLMRAVLLQLFTKHTKMIKMALKMPSPKVLLPGACIIKLITAVNYSFLS